jgi:hypothetical protein
MMCWRNVEAAVAELLADKVAVAAGAGVRAERPEGAAVGCMARCGFAMSGRR